MVYFSARKRSTGCSSLCGSIYSIIPDFIECGLDILDPLQTTAVNMDLDQIKHEFGDKLSFHGSIDIQEIMPFGTVDEVSEEVKLRIKQLGPGGGFILAPAHAFQDDTPPENIVAMYQSGRKFGPYPIDINVDKRRLYHGKIHQT